MQLPELTQARLLRRYKRFLADVETNQGEVLTVHCPNTGAMTGCAEPGARVWLSRSDNPKRKYKHTWELIETPSGIVSINTGRANALVAEAFASSMSPLGHPLGQDDVVQAEARIPEGDGRFDFAVRQGGQLIWVEVKSVTLLLEGAQGAFPDAVSTRALKHVAALCRRVSSGERALLVFCAQHCGIESIRLADHIDPVYARAVAQAHGAGVEVCGLGCVTNLKNFTVNRQLPFLLG